MANNELVYNPLEDTDKPIPVYKNNGKNLIIPVFICGVKLIDITSKKGEKLKLADFEFEVHESAEKVEIDIFPEDEDGNYVYTADPIEKVSGSIFVGKRFQAGNNAKVWKNMTKGSGRMNKILLQNLREMGIEIEKKEIKHDGKKIKVDVIPEFTEDLFLGLPLFGWMSTESYTNRNGDNVSYKCINKVIKIDGADKLEVMENTLNANNSGGGTSSKKEDDPFGDLDDDLPF